MAQYIKIILRSFVCPKGLPEAPQLHEASEHNSSKEATHSRYDRQMRTALVNSPKPINRRQRTPTRRLHHPHELKCLPYLTSTPP
ncbi:hypothetical protein Pcinc_044269 [Petrolisthes cinctipes]|uniref:Uncharacterized protein n=1 Tax=Petrolisthes cinctipes TaxID=88211 RepID=A0AAE1BH58_PETCI|nr:hypothetical protein Pcinc_044269 [Petrolisthes cinctipes]